MGKKSKDKGKAGEREACTIFKEVFGGNWQRVFGSGAFVGGKNAYRREYMEESQLRSTKADVHTPDFMPNLILEVKNYADFPFHQLLQQKEIILLESWLEEVYTCIDKGDFWLLCVKITRKGWFVLFDPEFANFIYDNHSVYYSKAQNKNFIITAPLKEFLKVNKDRLLELCSDKK